MKIDPAYSPGGVSVHPTQASVDAATAQQQDLFKWRSELAVEPGVDDRVQETVDSPWATPERTDSRVEETVGVAEPQEEGAEPVRYALGRLVAERLNERQYEERQPVETQFSTSSL